MKKDFKISSKKHAFVTPIVVFLLIIGSVASAQNAEQPKKATEKTLTQEKGKEVSGTVMGDGMGLPGVSVILQESNIGTVTDSNGNFTFPELLKKGDVLVFHYLGFKSTKHVVNDELFNVINLEFDIIETPEIVLMGDPAVHKNFKFKKSHWKKRKASSKKK